MTLGAVVALAGSCLLLTIGPDSSLIHVAIPCFIMGIGFGLAAAPSVIAAQSAVGWSSRGVATGATMFARSVGSAVGVAVFGAVVNSKIAGEGGGTSDLEHLAPSVLDPAIHATFVGTVLVAVLMVVVAAFMPTRVVAPTE
jgi:MFS family permease